MSTTTTRDIAGQLPTKPVGSMIPINQHSQRLDIRAVVPDTALWSAYKERTKQEKPCNHFHLLGKCKDSGSCAYSHGCLEPRFLAVLRFIVRGQPCARGSNCRRDNCVNGHICQKPGCTGSGTGCRLKPYMHKIDPVATEWVMPETDVIASPSADTGEEESLDSRSVSGALSPDQGVTLNDGWS